MAKGILIKSGGGISLPTLTNEAMSDELLVGKELINSEGQILVGTGDLVELNYDVVAYAAESDLPTTAEENTIAVITDTTITSHVFSITAPSEPEEGMVWFSVGNVASVEINAITENSINLYPGSAKQYVNGAWTTKTVRAFKNGAWKALSITLIPDTAYSASEWSKNKMTITNNSASMLFQCSSMYGLNHSYGLKAVDVTPFTTLRLTGTFNQQTGNGHRTISYAGLFTGFTNNTFVTGATKTSTTNGEITEFNSTYDISSLTGRYYFGFLYYTDSGNSSADYHGNCTISSAILE